jgi:hypothetical protein
VLFPRIGNTILLVLVSVVHQVSAQNQWIRVTSPETPIRMLPNANGGLLAMARNGDCYELDAIHGKWYGVYLFAGEVRYILREGGEVIGKCPPAEVSRAVLSRTVAAVEAAETRATKEAIARYPNDWDRQVDFERMVADRYRLAAFRRFGVPTSMWLQVQTFGFPR